MVTETWHLFYVVYFAIWWFIVCGCRIIVIELVQYATICHSISLSRCKHCISESYNFFMIVIQLQGLLTKQLYKHGGTQLTAKLSYSVVSMCNTGIHCDYTLWKMCVLIILDLCMSVAQWSMHFSVCGRHRHRSLDSRGSSSSISLSAAMAS